MKGRFKISLLLVMFVSLILSAQQSKKLTISLLFMPKNPIKQYLIDKYEAFLINNNVKK